RFSKQLGFDSWEQLKLSIAAVQAASNGKKDIDPIVASDDSVDTICMKVESLLNATIKDLFYTVYKQALERAIAHVKKAEKIHL
ncbi:MurR/RpiR family transcriptional regulator, partial [Enterococcus faecalis]